MDIDVYRPKDVDLSEFAHMQQKAFEELLKSMGVDGSFMTPAFYNWKYNGPFGGAKMVLAKDNGRIVASTVNHALEIQCDGETYRLWQNGDSAMLPEYRGQGLYHKCVAKAVEALLDNELIYGFPNANSKRGFSAHVPTDKGIIPLLAAPSVHPLWASDKNIAEVNSFKDVALNHTAFFRSNKAALTKSRDYLEWRYGTHPVNRYVSYRYNDVATGSEAVVVTRKADIGGRRVLVVMELLGTCFKAMRKAVHYAIRRQRTGLATLMFNNSLGITEMMRLGFVKVPPRFLPKTQLLFVHANSGRARELLNVPWQIQMGDWDGF